MAKYSQFTAYKALALAALRSISKSPSSVIFTIAFPLVFILVFGYLGDRKASTITIGIAQQDSSLHVDWIAKARQSPLLNLRFFTDDSSAHEALGKAKISARLKWINKDSITITGFSQDNEGGEYLKKILQLVSFEEANTQTVGPQFINQPYEGRKYKAIDFILPGQLGFSLIAASIFGTAFVFFSLRQQLVLKRFFATPVKKYVILLAEGTARISFQMIGAIAIIAIGYYLFDFTLINGFQTVVSLLFLSVLALIVFMSFGFVISGVAKNESTIPPLANIVVLPQFLLAGTFFPVESFPVWLQGIAKVLPLTYLNDAMRTVAFEGASLWDVKNDILILVAWGIIGYGLSVKLFRWE